MRYIHVFVSSTFSDMHRERDLLHQIVGLINRDISDQGYQVVLRDLRYGIDTANIEVEKEVEKKVLAKCFEAINQCQIFVLLMGGRYGSVFEDMSIPQLYLPDQELAGMSVTHLEVEYGMRKIKPNNIVAFVRKFSGNPSSLPISYQENEAGIAKQSELLERLNCYTDVYSARMTDGEFVIDEYYFLKHGQGVIQRLIDSYIHQQEQLAVENTSVSVDSYSEALSSVLHHELQRKSAEFPEQYREFMNELTLWRIQTLLHLQDYERIKQLGSDGNAILEYRKNLIAELSNDPLELLREICCCIAAVVEPKLDVFELLLVLAAAQQTELSQMGGISIHELMMLIKQEKHPKVQTLEEWLSFRHESSGTRFRQSPSQRAMACFLENQILLSHTDEGYMFLDNQIAKLLCKKISDELNSRISSYIASIFWFLPDPIGAWVALLDTSRYDLALSCLKAVALDERFTNRFLDCVVEVHAAEQAVILLEKFICWMIEEGVEEAYILYILEVCCWIMNSCDDALYDQRFRLWIEPLYQRICCRYFKKHRDVLDVAGRFLLWHIDNEVVLEHLDLPLSEQMEDTDILADAVLNLFRRYDLSQPEGLKAYLSMVNILTSHLDQLEPFIRLLRAAAVRTKAYWNILCENLLLMTFGNEVLESEKLIQILASVMCIHCQADSTLTAIEALNQHLVKYASRLENDDLCISALHIVYDIVLTETKLRRTEWCSWSRAISCDVIDKLYRLTDDTVVQEIAILQDELMFAEPEELSEIDASSLREVEKYYNELNKAIHRTSD